MNRKEMTQQVVNGYSHLKGTFIRRYTTYAKRMMWALGIGILVTVCVSMMSGFTKDCSDIRDSVLRLHILANSDSEQDQTLKLQVRDRILKETEDLFNNTTSVLNAQEQAAQNIRKIIDIAEDEVQKQGFDYKVDAQVCNQFFDTRVYENFSLPAGHYNALRITIGEAKGHNWWCVLYPPMCLPGAMPQEELQDSDLTSSQCDIIEKPETYQVEFAIVELWEKLKMTFEK